VDVILRLLSLASVFVGFGEGVCTSSQHMLATIARSLSPSCADDRRNLCDVKKAMRECRSELKRCRASHVARAAEGSLTEGFEVLDSCHKSVCSVKRVWPSL
jgi:hypothetical protein